MAGVRQTCVPRKRWCNPLKLLGEFTKNQLISGPSDAWFTDILVRAGLAVSCDAFAKLLPLAGSLHPSLPNGAC